MSSLKKYGLSIKKIRRTLVENETIIEKRVRNQWGSLNSHFVRLTPGQTKIIIDEFRRTRSLRATSRITMFGLKVVRKIVESNHLAIQPYLGNRAKFLKLMKDNP